MKVKIKEMENKIISEELDYHKTKSWLLERNNMLLRKKFFLMLGMIPKIKTYIRK